MVSKQLIKAFIEQDPYFGDYPFIEIQRLREKVIKREEVLSKGLVRIPKDKVKTMDLTIIHIIEDSFNDEMIFIYPEMLNSEIDLRNKFMNDFNINIFDLNNNYFIFIPYKDSPLIKFFSNSYKETHTQFKNLYDMGMIE